MNLDFEPRRIDVESVDEVPERYGLSFSVRPADPIATPNEPPRIRIGFSNERPTGRAYSNGLTEVFGGTISTGDAPRLVLLQPGYPVQEGDDPLRPAPGTVAFDMPLVTTKLEAVETKSVEYDVWDGSNEGEPFATGTYRFEDTYERTQTGSEPRDRFVWGFSIDVGIG